MPYNFTFAIIEVNHHEIKNLIYTIRGKKVMLDSDLALIYNYEVKRLNEQVKRNIERFPEDFMFKLTKEEVELVKSQIATSRVEGYFSGQDGGRRKLPNVFTEQGIYMLMTVLKGDLAIEQSKALVRTFKQMKDYLIENQNIIGSDEWLQLSVQTNQNTVQTNQNAKDILKIKDNMATKEDLKKVMENFINPDSYKHFLIMDGHKIESDCAYAKIYSSAQHSIYIVDNYISLKTLELLREPKDNINIVIFSDNMRNRNMLTNNILADFQSDYPDISISFKVTNGKYHDRYIAIDYNTNNEKIYHCGASSKDAGTRVTTISRIDDTHLYHSLFDELLHNPILNI
ncbi:ORF6N domain-containing protein [Pasteurella atlantica]|uniref:ORF6N domain-containing protein n=2 Tax=Pasteurellaceae TaxID=712 RepID=A0ACC6HKV8_9PAST|nr:ORF6N domain-containing protein [Pasteurella atlantica]MDP8051500.1 ORF6N domain-containing protein [Pasteurella atlantica]MDP8104921.1 ORF6N domain-containing protein [Pasteurella atlantica]MDP8148295.1 ORF6N domain-containing protein [Pasteurella atlantica]